MEWSSGRRARPCGTAPALKSMERASLAAEKAAENTEKAMEEFEKLNRQTQVDLPKTLAEMEAAGRALPSLQPRPF